MNHTDYINDAPCRGWHLNRLVMRIIVGVMMMTMKMMMMMTMTMKMMMMAMLNLLTLVGAGVSVRVLGFDSILHFCHQHG